jgi:Uma2 family endonuclease
MSSTLLHTPPRTIGEVFESLPEGTRCELINNTLVMSPSPLDTHQKVLGKIFTKLFSLVEEKKLGELRIAPYDVHFDEKNIFQPDIILIADKNTDKIDERGFFGAPDLIIEILSPSNARFDKEEKKLVYEKFGVKEYFIVEPYEKQVTGFILLNDAFALSETKAGIITSKVFDFNIRF